MPVTRPTPRSSLRRIVRVKSTRASLSSWTGRSVARLLRKEQERWSPGRWSSGFSLGRLTVVVVESHTHTVAIGLLTRQERRLKPELQQLLPLGRLFALGDSRSRAPAD